MFFPMIEFATSLLNSLLRGKNINEEQKTKVPIDNLNEMTFGRLLLGQIIISDELL